MKDSLSDRETDNRSNQNREEFKSTYLPLHRPLHAASVQSKSRTEIISDQTEQLVPGLCTAYEAHLPDQGVHFLIVLPVAATAQVPSHALILHHHYNSLFPDYHFEKFLIVSDRAKAVTFKH